MSSKTEEANKLLFKFVRNYFEEHAQNEEPNHRVHPIYLQHDGHSRTIVGFEAGKVDSLLLFDPGTRQNQIDAFKSNTFKGMTVFRRGLNAFKKPQYQLLIIRGVLGDNEYEQAKFLKTTRIGS